MTCEEIEAMLLASSISVCLGILLTVFIQWLSNRRKREAHWNLLRAELELCRERSYRYLTDRKAAPLYQLPTNSIAVAIPALLADGAIEQDKIVPILKYFVAAQDLNRGLDEARASHFELELRNAQVRKPLGGIVRRNVLYACKLVRRDEVTSAIPAAILRFEPSIDVDGSAILEEWKKDPEKDLYSQAEKAIAGRLLGRFGKDATPTPPASPPPSTA